MTSGTVLLTDRVPTTRACTMHDLLDALDRLNAADARLSVRDGATHRTPFRFSVGAPSRFFTSDVGQGGTIAVCSQVLPQPLSHPPIGSAVSRKVFFTS